MIAESVGLRMVTQEQRGNIKSLLNPHDLLCVKKVYNVKSRPDFFYQGTVPGSPAQYSEAFIKWLQKQMEKEATFFAKCREKAKDCPKSGAKAA